METKAVVISRWEDIVFENRNKMYGAYKLRREYAQRVIMGLGVSVAIFAGLLWASGQTLSEVIHDIKRPLDGTIVCVLPPPPIVRIKPPQQQLNTKQPKANAGPPLVVTEPVVSEPIDLIDVSSTTDETGTGDVVFSSDGVGTVPAIEEPAIEPVETVVVAGVMPQYPGGVDEMMKYFKKAVKYPYSAQRVGVEGTVFVQFLIMFDGSVDHVEVIKGIHPDCDREAVRVIKNMPNWSAGNQNGRAVNVRMVLPIKFKINN